MNKSEDLHEGKLLQRFKRRIEIITDHNNHTHTSLTNEQFPLASKT